MDQMTEKPTAEFVEAARHVLYHLDDERGYEPGGFRTRLLEAWAYADLDNRAALAAAFPDLGRAVAIASAAGKDALALAAGIAS